jgi:hypothetical protein
MLLVPVCDSECSVSYQQMALMDNTIQLDSGHLQLKSLQGYND